MWRWCATTSLELQYSKVDGIVFWPEGRQDDSNKWIKVYLLVMMVINISLVVYLYYSQFLYKCEDLITTAPESKG